MKLASLLFIVVVTLMAQPKGYIDMHGGKKDTLTDDKSSFIQMQGLGINALSKPQKNIKQITKKTDKEKTKTIKQEK